MTSMGVDVERWLQKFRREWEDKPIDYLDESDEWQQDSDPLFGSISNAIQTKDYQLSVDELERISEWKLQSGRNNKNIRKNTSESVTHQLRAALEAETDSESVETLTELSGVGVPMASTILTVAQPSTYAIIDYRAFRGLGGIKPKLREFSNYEDYAEFLNHFRTYLKNPVAYQYYMNHVRNIAKEEDLSARQVDMALWAFDEEMA